MARPSADERGPREPVARTASDALSFGQEFGRVLSDGRIVGRAEPYAKVFPSSRAVKRAVGAAAWSILEDIALDASLDAEGRLVAETNVRRIAANLALSKNTVTKHLAKLRDFGFVLHEEIRADRSGRWGTARYVLDPSACLERFTVTPAADRADLEAQQSPAASTPEVPGGQAAESRSSLSDDGSEPQGPCPKNGDTAASPPCPKNWDTDPGEPPCPKNWYTGENGEILPKSARVPKHGTP